MKKIPIKQQSILDNQVAYIALLLFLVVIAIIAAITIKQYLGYATAVSVTAGDVNAVKMSSQQDTVRWHGLFGLAFYEPSFVEEQSVEATSGEVSSGIFVFECIDPFVSDQELYASTNENVSFSNVTAGDYSMIDSLFNTTENVTDSAQNSFTSFVNLSLGSTVIEAPAIYTYVDNQPDFSSFWTAILNASGELLLAMKFYQSSLSSFKSSSTRFQIMLPTPNASTKYYFFADPNDICPSGFSTGQLGDAFIEGYLFDANTSLPIEGATISAGGNQTTSQANGFFNLSVEGGRTFNLLAFKIGYLENITIVNTTVGVITQQNLTLTRLTGLIGPNATIAGYVRDNETNLTIENVTINIAGMTTQSNATGNFTFNVTEGTYTITAMKEGYLNFIDRITLTGFENLSYFINLTPFSEGTEKTVAIVLDNGSVSGTVRDNETNLTLDAVRVIVNGVVNFTPSSGRYNLSATEGSTYVIGTKTGYYAHVGEINITAFNETVHNFSLQPVITGTEIENGTILGLVQSSEGERLSEAFVSAAGVQNFTDGSGNFGLYNIPEGTHNIVSSREGYRNYVAEVNVTAGEITYHNITLETLLTDGLGDGLGEGQGPGSGPGLGPGEGPGTGIIAQIEQPTEILDYNIAVRKIIEKLKQGQFLTVPIEITNYKEESVNVRFSVEGNIKQLLRLNRNRITLDSSSAGEVTVTILGNKEPGVYQGWFVLSGDIEDRIPIYVLLFEEDLLDVEGLTLDIRTSKKKIAPARKLNYKVDIKNLLEDESYKVDLTYQLESIENNVTIPIESENIFLLTAFTLVKSYVLPEDLPLGEYVLRVTANYLGFTSTDQTIIEIKLPWYLYKLFGLIPLWVLALIIAGIGASIYGFYWWRKKQESKKRYHIELDYNQLPKPGPRTAFVGLIAETTKKTYFDLDQMQTHTLVAGSTGSGKSVASQGIVEEALIKGTSVMVFDPTVQWTGFLSRCQDKKFLALYPKFGLKKSDARAFPGNIHQVIDSREIIDFDKYIKPGEINIFVVNKLDTRDYEIFVSNTIREVFHNNMPESRQLKLVLVFDEFHRLLPKYGGTGQVLIQIERAAREFRKWGVGLVLISQVISDFQPEVLANINTQLQMRTKDEGDLTRTKNEYGQRYLESLVKASVGAGMVENSNYNKGKPYFVQFRPLLHNTGRVSDEDLENYNKYNKIIEDLDYQLEQLSKEGIDIFDLQLELKLALDKVKAASFNMVDIYLEGLKPRVQQQWEKIGKAPQKRVVRRISEAELQKELKKAKKWRAQQEGKEVEEEPEEQEQKPETEEGEDTAPDKSAEDAVTEKSEQENTEANLEAIERAKKVRDGKQGAAEVEKLAEEQKQRLQRNKEGSEGSGNNQNTNQEQQQSGNQNDTGQSSVSDESNGNNTNNNQDNSEGNNKENNDGNNNENNQDKTNNDKKNNNNENKKDESNNQNNNNNQGGSSTVEKETASKQNPISETIKKIDEALQTKNKQTLISLYKELQVAYKTASVEVRQSILQRTKLIQQVLAR